MKELHESVCEIKKGFTRDVFASGSRPQILALLRPAQEHVVRQQDSKQRVLSPLRPAGLDPFLRMNHPEQIATLIAEGLSPSEASKRLQMPIVEVIQHLAVAIHEGRIRRMDVYATLPSNLESGTKRYLAGGVTMGDLMAFLDKPAPAPRVIVDGLWDATTEPEELRLYLMYRERDVIRLDTYELLVELERSLHGSIKLALQRAHGEAKHQWWLHGVPVAVRKACAAVCQDEQLVIEEYECTTLVNLITILDDQWSEAHFDAILPKAESVNKKKLKSALGSINTIRNRVMHPTRQESISLADYDLVKEMHQRLKHSAWRF